MKQIDKLIALKKLLDDKLIDEAEFLRLKNELALNNDINESEGADNYNAPTKSLPAHHQPQTNHQKNTTRNVLIGVGALLILSGGYFLIKQSNSTSSQNANMGNQAYTEGFGRDGGPQKIEDIAIYPKPLKVNYKMPDNANTDLTPIFTDFYPIGWSQDGKFAYLTVPPDEAKGCNNLCLFVQDMITDEVIYTLNSREFCEEELDNFFTKAWGEMSSKITEKLKKFRIYPSSSNMILPLPFLYNGNEYDFHLYNRLGENEMYASTVAEATVINLKTNGVIGKKVFGEKYGDGGPLSNQVVGYLKSPFENRIAALYVTEFRGWEGPPNIITFDLVGCAFP